MKHGASFEDGVRPDSRFSKGGNDSDWNPTLRDHGSECRIDIGRKYPNNTPRFSKEGSKNLFRFSAGNFSIDSLGKGKNETGGLF
jgi:hypothetical protein